MPLPQNIYTRPITSQDLDLAPAAIALLNRTQGNGLFAANYLEDRVQDSNSFVVGAFQNRNLVGVGVAEFVPNLDYFLPFDPNLPRELEFKSVASFSTLSILESLQGQGIGQLLSRLRLEWLASRNCDVVLGVSWVSGLAHTSHRTFEKTGFRVVASLDDFYVKSSLKKPFDCPGCHQIPCVCGAVLYRFDFN